MPCKLILPFLFHFFILICLFNSCSNKTDTAPADNDTTVNIITPSELDKEYKLDQIKLPPGFSIHVFAKVSNARSLCWGTKGTLFAGNREEDKVYAIVDADKNGVADKVYTIASGLNTPCGVAFKNGSLYVAEINRILRFDNIEEHLAAPRLIKWYMTNYLRTNITGGSTLHLGLMENYTCR